MAQNGGVLVRAGHTEAGCDFAQLAGLEPAGSDLRNPQGRRHHGAPARPAGIRPEHGLKIGTIRDLIQHRSETEKLIECVADKDVDCAQGRFRLRAFADRSSGDVHLAMSCGEIKAGDETLVRVHEAVCVLDFLDHGSRGHTYSVDFALRSIAEKGSGVLVMLHRAESGNALLAALKKVRRSARPTPGIPASTASARRSCANSASARCA
jgi:3,4-dihydroxy 2-butanone 4-phosphate synthase/GTP cyclohydrolase II